MSERRRNHSRPGFTLVELLVVISIIGLLVGLLIPAIHAAKELARVQVCSSRQRQLALAALEYVGTNGHFPGYTNLVGPDSRRVRDMIEDVDIDQEKWTFETHMWTQLGTPNAKRLNWAIMLFPYIDRMAEWTNWSRDPYNNAVGPVNFDGMPSCDQMPNPYSADNNELSRLQTLIDGSRVTHPDAFIDLLVCPSNPPDLDNLSPLAFVVNGGAAERPPAYDAPPQRWGPSHKSAVRPANKPYIRSNDAPDGVFLDRFFGNQKQTLSYLADNDGTSRTLMLSENIQWAHNYRPRLQHAARMPCDCNTEERTVWSMLWWTASVGPNADCSGQTQHDCGVGRPINNSAVTLTGRGADCPGDAGYQKMHDDTPGAPTVSRVKASTYTEHKSMEFIDPQSQGIRRDMARPSSRHSNGVNVAFCDGHTQFLREEIDYRVYQQLMIPADRKQRTSDDPTEVLLSIQQSFYDSVLSDYEYQ